MKFLSPKKIYIVYLSANNFKDKTTMVINARSSLKAMKIAYKTFNPFDYEITNVVDAEEVFDILRMGDNKR